MQIRCFKFHLFAQLCLLLAALWIVPRAHCEQQYEFECANKECSDILLEGHTNFAQAGKGELFTLGKGEALSIYGISEEFYLGRKNHRNGLVKKSYFKVSRSYTSDSKDKQLVKASFRNNELVLNSQIDSLNLNDSVADQGNETFRVLTTKENSTSDSSGDSLSSNERLKEESLSEAPAKPSKLNEPLPLVKKLHSRLASGEDPAARRATEDLNLKVPEVHNYSDERPDDKQGASEFNEVPAAQNESLPVESSSSAQADKKDADDLSELRESYKQPVDDQSVAFKVKEIDAKNDQTDKSTQTEPVQPAAASDPVSGSVQMPAVSEPSSTVHPTEHPLAEHPPAEHPPAATQPVDEQAVSSQPPIKQELPGSRHTNNSIPKNYDHPEPAVEQQEAPREEAPKEEFRHLPAEPSPAEPSPAVPSPAVPSPAEHPPVEHQPAIAEPVHEPAAAVTDQPPVVKQELPGSRHTDNSIPKNYDHPEAVLEQQEAPREEAPKEAPQEEPPREEFRHPKQITKPERKANIKNLNRKSREEENSTGESSPNKQENDSSILPTTADNSIAQEPIICASPGSLKAEEPSIAIIALRSLLSNFTHLLPEGMVLFLESGLQVSVRLLMFVFIIGLLWIILYAIKLFSLSMSNETTLKNHLYESQNKLSQLQRERDDLRNRLNAQNLRMSRGLEEQRYEVDQLVNRLNAENEQLKDGRLVMESKLREQLELVKALQEKIDCLNKDSGVLFKENDELSEQLSEELRTREQLQNKLNQLDELNKELIVKSEQTQKIVKERDGRIDFLNEQLDEQRKLTTEKEIEIGCLNKMLSELKEDRELCKRNADENGSAEQSEGDENADGPSKAERRQSTSNFYDVVKLRCEIEKIEKERHDANERLKVSLEKVEVLERKLDALEQASSQNDEVKSKVLKEKEDAEKYLDFLKKYYSENKNELQKELGVYQYKEKQLVEEKRELQDKLETLEKRADESEQKYQQCKKEFEDSEKQMRDELLAANKSASDYWKSAQTLKSELATAKKDAEYLRQQLRGPSASASSNPSPAPTLQPPVLPKEVFEVLLGVNTGHLSSVSGLPNLNSFNNVSGANFMTAPSPIPPQSLGPNSVDYQANYHNSFSSLPFTSQPDSSIYNHVVPTSAAFPQIDPPMMLNSNGLISNLANSSLVNSSLANSNLMNSHPANSNLANSNLANSSLANSNLMNSNPMNSNLMNHSLVGNSMANVPHDVYAGQDYQYASLPANLSYHSSQQFDHRFDSPHPTNAATFANQQQQQQTNQRQHPNQWNAGNAYSFVNNSDMNQTDNSMNHHATANSPHPSLHNV